MHCTGKVKSGGRVKITCTTSRSAKARSALRLRLIRAGARQVATQRAIVHGRTASMTLHAAHAIKHGTYVLRISIAQVGAPAAGQLAKLHL